MCFGAEYFGTFTRAWYTLFQILTGESWSEAIARPILFGWNDYGPISIYLSAVYFILFVLINAFILFNVFVAVLLDKVVAPDEPAKRTTSLRNLLPKESHSIHGRTMPSSLRPMPRQLPRSFHQQLVPLRPQQRSGNRWVQNQVRRQ